MMNRYHLTSGVGGVALADGFFSNFGRMLADGDWQETALKIYLVDSRKLFSERLDELLRDHRPVQPAELEELKTMLEVIVQIKNRTLNRDI
jgi:hypothetical protein